MSRGLSKEYIELKDRLLKEHPDNIGLQLGDLCHRAGVPPSTIARALGVAVTSVYRWMRGSLPRTIYAKHVEKIVRILMYGLDHSILPPANGTTIEQALSISAQELRNQQRA